MWWRWHGEWGRHSLCASGGAGSERGREPPCPELHREKSLEKAADSGRSEGGRNEGAEAARASGRGRHGMREHMLRSRESGAMCSPPVGVDKGEGEWAGVSLWRSQGHNREKGTQCSWFGIGRSGGGGMDAEWCGIDECVCGASGARPPAFCGAGCGERREARAPPRPPPRDDHAGVDGHFDHQHTRCSPPTHD